jgi:type IV pilus assembly protein PilA
MSVLGRQSKRRIGEAAVQRGFSLIELLIVVAIILIIAAIAIPNLMKSKMTANEASAVESVRTITTAENAYAATCPDTGFSATLVELNTGAICAAGQNLMDDILGASDPSFKSGYQFTYTVTAVGGMNTAFTITGVPTAVGTTGQRGFYSDQTDVIRYTTDGSVPTNASSPLE